MNSVVQVCLDSVSSNLGLIRRRAGPAGVIAVVKANAYGHGANAIARHLKANAVERLAVGTLREAVSLRMAGIHGPIHLLGELPAASAAAVVAYQITPSVCSLSTVRALVQARKAASGQRRAPTGTDLPVRIHVNVDTGMCRTGLSCDSGQLSEFVARAEAAGVYVEGLFTHFHSAWESQSASQQQMDRFLTATERWAGRKLRHAANTAATLRGYATDLDYVRVGGLLYGQPPTDAEPVEQLARRQGFRSALSWHARPTFVKQAALL